MQARGTSPAVTTGGHTLGAAEELEFLSGPIGFALLGQQCVDGCAQLDQHLDIECGVVQPRIGQRTLGPVGRTVAFGQAQTQEPLHHGRQVDPFQTGQPPGQFGVIQRGRTHPHLGQARQILVGGVQDPLIRGQHLGHRPQHIQGAAAVVDRVDQDGARSAATDLNQVGPVGVPETGGAFGVDRERPVAAGQPLGGVGDLLGAGRQFRDPVGGSEQRRGRRFVCLCYLGLGARVGIRHLRRGSGTTNR